ncbi:MAG TPA: glutamate synthase [Eubacteriales bacterium]|nr:glutamate synthase [Eubacteriales bacterium]
MEQNQNPEVRRIDARGTDYHALNACIRQAASDVEIVGALGQRYLGDAMDSGTLTIRGTAGNALGAYLNGGKIVVYGNAQDAAGDTMNKGEIIVHGSVGDTVGYSMRGGCIYVRDSAGYRAGVHMKAYGDTAPVLVVGGRCGSFLGEYQAGGTIIVLGLDQVGEVLGYFCGTGMHGGAIYVRGEIRREKFPRQVRVCEANADDLARIEPYLKRYSALFNRPIPDDGKPFWLLTPNSNDPYRQLYVTN